MLKWFPEDKCASFEIQKKVSISNPKITSQKLVQDAEAAQKLMKRINALPTQGEKMVSFAENATQLDAVFKCGSQKVVITFINGNIKTPATSFFTGSNTEAKAIYHELTSLLIGEYGKPVLTVIHLAQEFPDFKITYNGKEEVDGKPATVSVTRENFLVKDKTNNEIKVTVTSGQASPQPVKFKVQGHEYTLFTYRSPSGVDLYPDHFQINN